MKEAFINNEIWTLTFSAAFQRAYVYGENVDNRQKSDFKSSLRNFVETKLLPQYVSEKVADKTHIENIYSLCTQSKNHSKILSKGQINFGVSQKLLNLFLKYKWCLNEIVEPPHFPVDRRIQENINYPKIVSWTKFKDEKDYLEIIDFVRKNMLGHKSLAEFELDHFERRVPSSKRKK
ncbi:hypothetical protein [Pareuzebyella sediminis]|uniref:hypothetical protein n=1 Tax=Pareuzebyella sediminis TaxID=2607998 RepID=UPI0011ED6600|nr:hypothetical protein [Pareuzebyella sediminis]